VCYTAHCLHTVTEDNPELLCSMNTAVLGALENVLLSSQPGMAHTLLRILAAGTIWPFLFVFFQYHFLLLTLNPLWSAVAVRYGKQATDKFYDRYFLLSPPKLLTACFFSQVHCGTRKVVYLQPVRPRPSMLWLPPCHSAWIWMRVCWSLNSDKQKRFVTEAHRLRRMKSHRQLESSRRRRWPRRWPRSSRPLSTTAVWIKRK